MSSRKQLTTLEKALEFNLDPHLYGTFAEIGAGQEVVRWFFQAGGAAGTISKSISAYDMQVSDAIYGRCQRYVCRERLEAMLDYEQKLNRDRLTDQRSDETCFFTFSDTVSARNYAGTNECHAWMGVSFQATPKAKDSRIIIHARMLDDNNRAQQEALGILGVNLIHSAYSLYEQPDELLASLLDGLSTNRIEIDMVDLSGPVFDGVDNRIMSLRLVELGLSGAAMFAANGKVLQPSEALRKRPLLIERGRFRPVTHVNIDMLEAATDKLMASGRVADGDEVLPIFEISMHSLTSDGEVCLDDFISRAEVLATTGHTVMISDYPEYYRLAGYLSRYTDRPIGIALGLGALAGLFDEQYYGHLDGGTLEGLGRLFKDQVCLFVYPQKDENSGRTMQIDSLNLPGSLHHMLEFLAERGSITPLDNISTRYLDIHSPQVLKMIRDGVAKWQKFVPKTVADAIVKRRLFGYSG